MKVEDPFASCGVFLHASIKILLAAGSGIHVQAGAVFNFLAVDVGAEFLVRLNFRLAPNFAAHSTRSASPPARWQFYCETWGQTGRSLISFVRKISRT